MNNVFTALEAETAQSSSRALAGIATYCVHFISCAFAKFNNNIAHSMHVNFTGTPLTEEDSDALYKLLQNTSVKLKASQQTIEEVQQLLHRRGLKELATHLRAKLDKG